MKQNNTIKLLPFKELCSNQCCECGNVFMNTRWLHHPSCNEYTHASCYSCLHHRFSLLKPNSEKILECGKSSHCSGWFNPEFFLHEIIYKKQYA